MTESPESPAEADDIVLGLSITQEQGGAPVLWAAKGSGLYRFEDDGVSWTTAHDSLALDGPVATTAIAATPGEGAGASLFAGIPGAVLASSDGGTTWRPAGLGTPPPVVSAIAVSPEYVRDGTVVAGTLEDGIFRSSDRGGSWVPSNFGLLDLGVLTLAMSPAFARDETIYAGTESGLYRSTNGGRSWRDVESSLDGAAIPSLALSPRFDVDHTVFAATESHALWRSRDRGTTWTPCGFEAADRATILVALDPDYPDRPRIIVLSEADVLWSGDDGAVWNSLWSWTRPEDTVTTFAVADWATEPPTLVAGCADGRVLRLP